MGYGTGTLSLFLHYKGVYEADSPVFDFYHNLNHFYGVLTDFCTLQNCPTMSAGPTLNFLWPDQNQRLVSLPAPTYIDFVMSWLQKLLDDEGVFPTKSGE